MADFKPGDKIKYTDPQDDQVKNGVVHGVRYVDDENGVPRVLTYLIDTGADANVQVLRFNLKGKAIKNEFQKEIAKLSKEDRSDIDKRFAVYAAASEKLKDLPEEIVEEHIRTPEMVDVPAKAVQSR